jgi:hypothetical protein
VEEREPPEVLAQPPGQVDGVGLQQEEAPQAVDDARHRRHQVDGRDQPGLDPLRGVVRDEKGQHERQGKLTTMATRATSTVPTSTAAMPILSSSGCQAVWVKKCKPVVVQRRDRLVAEEDADGAGHDQHEHADGPGRAVEDPVGRVQPGSRSRGSLRLNGTRGDGAPMDEVIRTDR